MQKHAVSKGDALCFKDFTLSYIEEDKHLGQNTFVFLAVPLWQ